MSRSKSPELEGLKLIRSVLKKESEESEQQMSESCDLPRSILKSNLKLEGRKVGGDIQNAIDEKNLNKSRKINADTRFRIKVGCAIESDYSAQYSVEKDNCKEGRQYETKQTYTVPSHENSTQDELNRRRIKSAVDGMSHVCTEIATTKNSEEILGTSDGEISSENHEACDVQNEGVLSHRQSIFSKQTR